MDGKEYEKLEITNSNPDTPTKNPVTASVVAGFLICIGIRKDGTSPQTGVKRCPVDTFLVRGRIHFLQNASYGMWAARNLVYALKYHNDIPTPKSGDHICGHRIFNLYRDSKGRHQSADWCKKISLKGGLFLVELIYHIDSRI